VPGLREKILVGTYLKPTEVLLDNQANISIIRPDLLLALEEVDKEVRINGVGGAQLSTRETGCLPGFLEYTTASILKQTY